MDRHGHLGDSTSYGTGESEAVAGGVRRDGAGCSGRWMLRTLDAPGLEDEAEVDGQLGQQGKIGRGGDLSLSFGLFSAAAACLWCLSQTGRVPIPSPDVAQRACCCLVTEYCAEEIQVGQSLSGGWVTCPAPRRRDEWDEWWCWRTSCLSLVWPIQDGLRPSG